jgi:hypothetical protein
MSLHSGKQLLLLEGTPPHLLAVSLDGQQLAELVSDCDGTPDGIAIDYANRHIYWTNMGVDWAANDGFIERIDFDGGNRTMIIPEGATFTPKQMQIDSARGLIYWCDREGLRVMRAKTDGSDITVLVQTGSSDEDRQDERLHCVGIALDLKGGRLFWTQKGPPNAGEGRIFSAPLELPPGVSPSERDDITLLFDALPEPIDLEWDEANELLYWTDRGDPPRGNTLNRAALSPPGTEPEILLTNLEEGIGLALDLEARLAYVSDLGGKVHVASLDTIGEPSVILSGRGYLTGIALWRAPAE